MTLLCLKFLFIFFLLVSSQFPTCCLPKLLLEIIHMCTNLGVDGIYILRYAYFRYYFILWMMDNYEEKNQLLFKI